MQYTVLQREINPRSADCGKYSPAGICILPQERENWLGKKFLKKNKKGLD